MVAMAMIMGVASPLWIRMIDPSVQKSLPPASAQIPSVPSRLTIATHLLALHKAAK
jgi:hypothetical protein